MACEKERTARVRSEPSTSEGSSASSDEGGSVRRRRRLVGIELDAAMVLADLAETGGAAERRLGKREGSGSPPEDRRLQESSEGSMASRSTHAYLVDERHGDKMSSDDMMDITVNVQHNSALPGSGIDCTTSHVSLFGHHTKGNLSEAEKEAKRTRRILANRESARQTIRRRQALRDELTRKATDLSLENENMKKEKEIAMEEYLSLKAKNKQLKDEMENKIRCKIESSRKHSCTEVGTTPSSSTELPLLAHSGAPFTPYAWPWPPHCYEEGNPPIFGGSRPLFYVPPCGWFYPSTQQIPGYCPPYSHVCRESEEIAPVIQQGPSSSSEAVDHVDRTSLPGGHKTEGLLSSTVGTERHKNVIGTCWKASSSQRENEMLGSCSQALNTCSFVKDEPMLEVRGESLVGHHDKVLSDKSGGVCIHPHEKGVDASAAAEAKKKRKELRKLKGLVHGSHGASRE